MGMGDDPLDTDDEDAGPPYSSNTRWALVPLNPKALTAARRGDSVSVFQGLRSVFT